MRDRLIELLNECQHAYDRHYVEVMQEGRKPIGENAFYADHLLAAGVIVTPCKVGDVVYYINTRPHIGLFCDKVYEAVVSRIVVNWLGVSIVIRIKTDEGFCEVPSIYYFGKIVFLTKEEAERALEERREG